MRGVFSRFLLLVLFLHFALILFTNRVLFLSRFDETYWKDRYEHSQWKLPLSTRTLGDDGLYLYEGYRLIRGGDPTVSNAEVPPLGKYVIGLSILLFGNGHAYGFLVTAAALFTFFLLAKTVLKSAGLTLAATTLVALDPLITSQFTLSMLDSLQLWFATLTLLLVAWNRPFLAGLGLGFFSQTKIPVFTPALFSVGVWVFWQHATRLRSVVAFAAGTVLAYLLPYASYFRLGHSLSDWLTVQKWIINFYRMSSLAPNRASILSALIIGRVQNLFTHRWDTINEWSPLWPLITLGGVAGFTGALTKVKSAAFRRVVPICGFTFFALLVYSLIPFWTRYLVMVLPFLYLGMLLFLRKRLSEQTVTLILTVCIIVNGAAASRTLFPTPQAVVAQFVYDWQNGFFSDMYEHLSPATKTVSREAFHRFGRELYVQGEIESVAIDVVKPQWSRWRSPQTVKVAVTYVTRHLGPFTEEKTLPVVKESGRWRIPWQWDLLITGLKEQYQLHTSVIPAKRGSILASDKTKLGEDVESYLIWVTPKLVDPSREESMLKLLESLFDHRVTAVALHQRLVGNSIPDIPIPLGVVQKPLEEEDRKELLRYPGLALTPHLGRRHRPSTIVTVGDVWNSQYFECCSLLYTTTTYDGKDGVEKERNSELKGYNGGKLVLRDAHGKIIRTILDLPKRDGKDVQL